MKNFSDMQFEKDLPNKRITVIRNFAAEPAQVWRAWTEPELLEQWFAPKPWKAETKSMDFREGGKWIYAMVGPENEKHWAMFNYKTIDPVKSYSGTDAFTDENGNLNRELPSLEWVNSFSAVEGGTQVYIDISFKSVEDIETIIKMGFKEGFTAALENLDQLFETRTA